MGTLIPGTIINLVGFISYSSLGGNYSVLETKFLTAAVKNFSQLYRDTYM